MTGAIITSRDRLFSRDTPYRGSTYIAAPGPQDPILTSSAHSGDMKIPEALLVSRGRAAVGSYPDRYWVGGLLQLSCSFPSPSHLERLSRTNPCKAVLDTSHAHHGGEMRSLDRESPRLKSRLQWRWSYGLCTVLRRARKGLMTKSI